MVEDNEPSRAAIDARLRALDNQSDYLAVFVWPDSFARFKVLKDVLVLRHFEYRLELMTADGKATRNAPRTRKPKVQ